LRAACTMPGTMQPGKEQGPLSVNVCISPLLTSRFVQGRQHVCAPACEEERGASCSAAADCPACDTATAVQAAAGRPAVKATGAASSTSGAGAEWCLSDKTSSTGIPGAILCKGGSLTARCKHGSPTARCVCAKGGQGHACAGEAPTWRCATYHHRLCVALSALLLTGVAADGVCHARATTRKTAPPTTPAKRTAHRCRRCRRNATGW
jgi:hypothetical protein